MKTLLTASIAVALLVPLAQAQDKPAAKPAAKAAAAAPATAFAEITWDELVPPDWDPLKQFKDMNFGVLNDADPKAAAMLKKMREVWDNAPVNNKLEGKAIRIPGYIVPLEEGKNGMTEFLLVPYFGACIHVTPPPPNQIILARLAKPMPVTEIYDAYWIEGTLAIEKVDNDIAQAAYTLKAEKVTLWE